MIDEGGGQLIIFFGVLSNEYREKELKMYLCIFMKRIKIMETYCNTC